MKQRGAIRLGEFSHKTRVEAIRRFRTEKFDFLIIGGGITGAAVARDAVRRGLKVALIERRDFASGTSSRSSKLIHGGLRYLENFELHLVFEALAERTLLLKTAPHLVRPLPFYWPIFEGAGRGRALLSAGLWLYDLLSLFRTPGWHRYLSRNRLLGEIPGLRSEGLKGGFHYYDASMWDDAMVPELLRSAAASGACSANYVEAIAPISDRSGRTVGMKVRDTFSQQSPSEFDLLADQVIVCAGPWTDQVGAMLSPKWQPSLMPSRGIHLVFSHERLPVPGALVMAHPKDQRISFVMPRHDLGPGVTIVGTTDGPAPANPDDARVPTEDERYLFDLLTEYFPKLRLGSEDVISRYIGIRPLLKPGAGAESLQKVSREHHIDLAPGNVVWAAGGKYTTHRRMAADIVDYALKYGGSENLFNRHFPNPHTEEAMNPAALPGEVASARRQAQAQGWDVELRLWDRYGAEAFDIQAIHSSRVPESRSEDLPGFPCLEAQLRFQIRTSMVMRLEDFYFRRAPLYLSLRDHGAGVADALARAWADELGLPESQARNERERLLEAISFRNAGA